MKQISTQYKYSFFVFSNNTYFSKPLSSNAAEKLVASYIAKKLCPKRFRLLLVVQLREGLPKQRVA